MSVRASVMRADRIAGCAYTDAGVRLRVGSLRTHESGRHLEHDGSPQPSSAVTAVMPSPARSDALRPTLTAATAALFGVGWGANQFAPLLLVYHSDLGVGEATIEAMFGVYAVGLIPGLLIGGPLSDRIGRRAVVLPAAALSVLATVLLMFGGQTIVALFAGRLLAGIVSGAVFSAATTWLRETSLAAGVGASAASRTAAAMSAGFGLGPLVAGMIAQWAPAPTVLPYVPHVLLMVAVLALLRRAPADEIRPAVRAALPGRRARLAIRGHPRFRWIVVPLAPWAFAAPVIAFALLPTVTGVGDRDHGIVFAAALAAITALTGAVVQPVARRLGLSPIVLGCAGLLTLAVGLGLGVVTVQGHDWVLVPTNLVLGCAYGLCLVGGLIEVQRLAAPQELARATSVYYALTYLGFAAPYLLTRAHAWASYPTLLTLVAGLALATAATIAVQNARHPSTP
jgi:MFS family permease